MTISPQETAQHELAAGVVRQATMGDTPLQVLTQALLVADPEVLKILKGELLEPLNRLSDQLVVMEAKGMVNETQLLNIKSLLETINVRVTKFQRITPYILMMSHLLRLNNIDRITAQRWIDEVELMVLRDLACIPEEQLELTDINYFRAIQVSCENAIMASVEGFTMRAITEQRRVIDANFGDRGMGRKKRFGIF